MSAHPAVERYRRRLIVRRRLFACCGVLGALAGAASALWGGVGIAERVLLVVVALAMAVAAGLLAAWVPDLHQIVRHLDGADASLEYGAELLLDEPATPLQWVQQRRTAHRIERALPPLPDDPRGRRLAAAGLLTVLILAVGIFAPRAGAGEVRFDPRPASLPPSGRTTREVLSFRSISVAVAPPPYTGIAPFTSEALEIEVPAASSVVVSVLPATTVARALLLTSAHDTVLLERAGEHWRAAIEVNRSLTYRVQMMGAGDSALSDDRFIGIRPDQPPTVELTRPITRRGIGGDEPHHFEILGSAQDDYGLTVARLVRTLTRGTGEAVRFSTDTVVLSVAGRRFPLRESIDLDALGMIPGDELYFHAEVLDIRGQKGRSSTVFLALADTAPVPLADFGGVSLEGSPEFFRSQRQIIMDTERLLAQRSSTDADEFAARSNAIGLDQGLLRLRYGQFVGDEFEETVSVEEEHQHDVEGNTTTVAARVKEQLQASLGQMWEAELRLRTSRPADALPFERRALELLKAAQAAERSYVRRTTIALPPLDVAELRLTGDIGSVRSRTRRESQRVADHFAETRRLLALLNEGGDVTPDAVERAAGELGAAAADEPRQFLPALRTMRELGDSVTRKHRCTHCGDTLRAQLTRALPRPSPRGRSGQSLDSLGARYLEILERE